MELTITLLENKFRKFNKMFFNNELPSIEFKLGKMSTVVAYYRYRKTFNGTIINNYIRFSTYFKYTDFDIDNTLIHEMIHYYTTYKKIKDTGMHGRVFMKIANNINAKSKYNITVKSLLKYDTKVIPTKEYNIIKYKLDNDIVYSKISKKYDIKEAMKYFKISGVKLYKTTNQELKGMTENRVSHRLTYFTEKEFDSFYKGIKLTPAKF